MSKLSQIAHSFRALPLWVQVWVGLLTLVNACSFVLLDIPGGQATAIAAVFVMLTNVPLAVYYGGMNRALSLPHLFAWIPLEIFLFQHLWLQDAAPLTDTERAYCLTVFIINGISLLFDVLDSWRWLNGERETPGQA